MRDGESNASAAAGSGSAKKKTARKSKHSLVTVSNGFKIGIATAKDIKNASRGGGTSTPSSSCTGLVRIPSAAHRGNIYDETARVIEAHEAAALPPVGGRPWGCTVRVVDPPPPSKGKAARDKRGPLFRWYKGRLELASLPHLLEKIPEVKPPAQGAETDGYHSEVAELQRQRRTISALSQEAADPLVHPQPIVTRTWLCPQRRTYKSRRAAVEAAEALAKRDALIDKVIFGLSAKGVALRSFRPTTKQVVEAGAYKFERDGLWVVGQEEDWQILRAAELRKEEEEEQEEQEGDLQQKLEANGPVDLGAIVPTADAPARAAASSLSQVPASQPATEAVSAEDVPVQAPEEQKSCSSASSPGSLSQSNAVAKTVTPSSTSLTDSAAGGDCGNDASHKVIAASPLAGDADMVGQKAETGVNGNGADKRKRCRRRPTFHLSHRWRLNQDQIDLCYDACMDHYQKVMYTVKARALFHELAEGFDVFRERGRGRYDMELDAFDTPDFSFLTDKEAPWMEIVRAVLGDEAVLIHKGCFLSLPGSEVQVYHQDGVHLNNKVQKPCHAVNVFIPLVDFTTKNGPTEFCLGTHILEYENWSKSMCETPLAKAGTPVIFDYRLGHRGMANDSAEPRPIVYLTYTQSTSTFKDDVNFSRRRYRKLGEIAKAPRSREERARQRKMWKGQDTGDN